jgi:hypothetical protein
MKVEQQTYLKKKALILIPETLQEKDMLKRCLGSRGPLYITGVFDEVESPDLRDRVFLWDNSQNRSERIPEQVGPDAGYRGTHRRADLGAFMNGLRRYINSIINLRLNEGRDFDSLRQYEDKIYEASQALQEIVKPLFEEEISG